MYMMTAANIVNMTSPPKAPPNATIDVENGTE